MSAPSSSRPTHRILLFDVDGTLTKPRNEMLDDMRAFLEKARAVSYVGVVGGSDLDKQREQCGPSFTDDFDYCFPENGLVAYKNGAHVQSTSLKDQYTEEQLSAFINHCLQYIAKLELPVKRGTFVEFRTGLINVSPIGRNCSQEEREAFLAYDNEHKVREKMVAELEERFGESMNLKFSIGGQISFDVFPRGWDKTFCLPMLEKDGFTEIHFFGDKTYEGGNDYEIFQSERTIGHTVTSPEDTMRQVAEVLGL